jgi:hypothetical protein
MSLLRQEYVNGTFSPSALIEDADLYFRCGKSGRTCVFVAPQKRRQRKRTDTRVAELEKEVRAMRLLLGKAGGTSPSIPEEKSDDEKYTEESDEDDPSDEKGEMSVYHWTYEDNKDKSSVGRVLSASHSQSPNDDATSMTSTTSIFDDRTQNPDSTKDVVDRGIISVKIATELFASYSRDLVQHFPGVILPSGSSAAHYRRSKPALFLAIITAASCKYDSELFGTLFDESIKLYAERIFIKGEKSLELVQALSITSVWYCPPKSMEINSSNNLRFYQYIHMAATMALDIGLGTSIDASAMSLEKSRAICACYLSCSGVAMRMRRSNMLRWTTWMSQCLDLLEKSPASTPLDNRLAAWVKLQIITDDYASIFAFDDISSTVNLADARMQVTLKSFERQLEDWRQNVESRGDIMNVSLLMAYYQNSIYLYERIAIDGNFDDKENINHKLFMPPQTITSIIYNQQKGPLSAAYVNAVVACIESMHNLLEAFLTLDIQALRVVPIIVYVRMSYSIVVLIKVYISTFSTVIGSVLDRKSLKVDHYLSACMSRLKEAAGGRKFRVPDKWLSILSNIDGWYRKHDKSIDQRAARECALDLHNRGFSNFGADLSGKNANQRSTIEPLAQTVGEVHYSFFVKPPNISNSGSVPIDSNILQSRASLNKEATTLVSAGGSAPPTSLTLCPEDSISSSNSQNEKEAESNLPHSQMTSFDPFMDFSPDEFSFLDQAAFGGMDGGQPWMNDVTAYEDNNFDLATMANDWSAGGSHFTNT